MRNKFHPTFALLGFLLTSAFCAESGMEYGMSAASLSLVELKSVHIDADKLEDAVDQVLRSWSEAHPKLPLPKVVFADERIRNLPEGGKIKFDAEDITLYDVMRYCSELATCRLEVSGDKFRYVVASGVESVKSRYLIELKTWKILAGPEYQSLPDVEVVRKFLVQKYGLYLLESSSIEDSLLCTLVGPPNAHNKLDAALLETIALSPYLLRGPDGTGVRR